MRTIKKKEIIILATLLYIILFCLSMLYSTSREIKIFCAGSLKIPLEKVAQRFESKYGAKAIIEPSGSLEAVRKITELHKKCDIIALADYKLIAEYLHPKYVDWYIIFATNSVVLAFKDGSKYSEELIADPSKWFEILMRPDVRYGFSDPNKDPCGYRAVGIIVLASIYYSNSSILRLLTSGSNIQVTNDSGGILIQIPENLSCERGDLFIRPKSVDLIALLEAGSIDYAFEYKSVAIQHNLSYIELPRELNLGDPSLDNFYRQITLRLLVGSSNEKTIELQSIAYGLAIPSSAENLQTALKFVKFLLSDEGREIFEDLGQRFIERPIAYGELLEELKEVVGG